MAPLRTVEPWPAPVAVAPVHAVVEVPGSKSLTNRALLLAALADGRSRLAGPLRARDTLLMADALTALGTRVVADADGWTVDPVPLRGPAEVDCGLAGTVMRFVPPVAALATGPVRFDGDARARERPIGELFSALRALGVTIEDGGRGLPFTVRGRGAVRGGPVSVDASASSQFVSGLLLAGAAYDLGLDLRHAGARVPSMPHVRMTVGMLRERGVAVDDGEPGRWRVAPGPIRAMDVVVEPDLSNATAFLAAAVATGGSVTVSRWPERTTQPADAVAAIFATFGARMSRSPAGLRVDGGAGPHAVDLDLHDVGELTPVVAALAALADGPSSLGGVGHLRGHETDRLAALATEIGRLGGDAEQTEDGLRLRPRALHGGVVRTYGDHRMAQFAALLGLVVPGVLVEDVAATGKTLPDFAERWHRMLGLTAG